MKVILAYHSLDTSGSVISLDPVVFASHVRWLVASGVAVVSLQDIAALPDTADAIALTFDDGFANFATVAAPLLTDARLPATIFVVSGAVGTTNEWVAGPDAGVPLLPLLSWAEIEGLLEAGFDIGSHTKSHPHLARLDSDQRCQDEIVGARIDIERRIGVRPRTFAYPYGNVSPRAVEMSCEAYDFACTTEMRQLHSDAHRGLLPRIDAYYFRREGQLEQWGTPGFARYVHTRALGRRVRRAMASLRGTA